MNRKTREIQLHKKVSKNYDKIREKQRNARYYSIKGIKELLKIVPKQNYKRILDVGCGTGIAYEIIRKRLPEAQYIGTDLSKDMINVGKRRYKTAKFYAMDCESLKFNENTFDLVIARSILHHVPHPEKAVAEMKRVVKIGGYIAVAEPHRTIINIVPREISKVLTGHFDKDHTNFTKTEMKRLFRKNNLKIKRVKYFGYLAYPFAFPDIIKIFTYLPHPIFKLLYTLDQIITELPLIKRFSWHLMISGKKTN